MAIVSSGRRSKPATARSEPTPAAARDKAQTGSGSREFTSDPSRSAPAPNDRIGSDGASLGPALAENELGALDDERAPIGLEAPTFIPARPVAPASAPRSPMGLFSRAFSDRFRPIAGAVPHVIASRDGAVVVQVFAASEAHRDDEIGTSTAAALVIEAVLADAIRIGDLDATPELVRLAGEARALCGGRLPSGALVLWGSRHIAPPDGRSSEQPVSGAIVLGSDSSGAIVIVGSIDAYGAPDPARSWRDLLRGAQAPASIGQGPMRRYPLAESLLRARALLEEGLPVTPAFR